MAAKDCMFQEKKFFGTTTVGERGQIVIPAEARHELNIASGEKLLVFGLGDMVVCTKLTNLQKLMEQLSGQLESIRSLLNKE